MIVFRYLSREVLLTFSAVSAVLLVIIMSGRFIKYLAQAAQGVLDPGVLLMVMGYRIPGFLQLSFTFRSVSRHFAGLWTFVPRQ